MKNLGEADWAGDKPRRVQICLAFCEPFELQVRKFKPIAGVDEVDRYWKDKHGAEQRTPIEPYALVDIRKTAAEFAVFIENRDGVRSAIDKFFKDPNVHYLVQKTYIEA